ncbi:MAG TPA: hypothetical protein VFC33_11675 [Acidimicrobiia bacterium]|nr:hypothetical protein [Acidimicrobiia bacterium]
MTDPRELPPGVGAGAPDVEADPAGAEARGMAMLEEAARAIVDGVAREVPGWSVRRVTELVTAWGADPDTRARAVDAAGDAGERAARRVTAALVELFAQDVEVQRATPLQIVRSVYEEPSRVLADAGVPPVVRDEFDERALPGDRYGLAPRGLGDLGDPELGPMQLAWGIGKATVIRARRAARGRGRRRR